MAKFNVTQELSRTPSGQFLCYIDTLWTPFFTFNTPYMKKYTLFLLLSFLTFTSYAQISDLKQIKVRGNNFITDEDKPFIFRGLNTSDPERMAKIGHWNKAYFEEMKNWGANIARLPIHPTAWRRLGKEKYLALLDEGVNWAKELGIYIIIDWHSIGNLRTEMYQSDNYDTTQKETFDFWRTMAKHFKGNTTVAFFELFNEPTTYNGQLGTCTWAEWKKLNEEMIDIIRAHGNTAIPLVAGFNWAYDLTDIANDPLSMEGIAYVSHPYPMKRKAPWPEQWTKDWGFVKTKYPLILTEIGFCGAEEKGAHIPVISDESYGEAMTKYCDEKGISWVVWVFDPQWAPQLFSDWNFTPTRQGVYFKKALQDRK
jgi:endoglucanase